MEKHHCMETLPVCVPVGKEEKLLMLLKHDPKKKQDYSCEVGYSFGRTRVRRVGTHRIFYAKGVFGD